MVFHFLLEWISYFSLLPYVSYELRFSFLPFLSFSSSPQHQLPLQLLIIIHIPFHFFISSVFLTFFTLIFYQVFLFIVKEPCSWLSSNFGNTSYTLFLFNKFWFLMFWKSSNEVTPHGFLSLPAPPLYLFCMFNTCDLNLIFIISISCFKHFDKDRNKLHSAPVEKQFH